MAREIDWTKPLREEDRVWAEQRLDAPAGMGKTLRERIQENDEENGFQAKQDTRSREDRIAELRATIAEAQTEIERLQNEQAIEDNGNVAVAGVPSIGLVKDNTYVGDSKPEGAPDLEERYSDGVVWTKAKLTEEITSRNAERTAQGLPALATTGNRSELVERLLQDDQELEESSN